MIYGSAEPACPQNDLRHGPLPKANQCRSTRLSTNPKESPEFNRAEHALAVERQEVMLG